MEIDAVTSPVPEMDWEATGDTVRARSEMDTLTLRPAEMLSGGELLADAERVFLETVDDESYVTLMVGLWHAPESPSPM